MTDSRARALPCACAGASRQPLSRKGGRGTFLAGEGGAKRRMRVFRWRTFMRDKIPVAREIARSRHASRTDGGGSASSGTALRDRRMQSLKFRRQAPIGSYIVDFLCVAQNLIVEVDGSQHVESFRDEARDAWLARERYRVLRFWNHEVLTTPEACSRRSRPNVVCRGDDADPHPSPSPARAGEGLIPFSRSCGRRWPKAG